MPRTNPREDENAALRLGLTPHMFLSSLRSTEPEQEPLDVAQFFAANKGHIAKEVAEAADQSAAFRRRLR